jgi:hypothetical protein
VTETTETAKTIETTGVKIGAWFGNDGSNVYGIMISIFAAAVSERTRQQREQGNEESFVYWIPLGPDIKMTGITTLSF